MHLTPTDLLDPAEAMTVKEALAERDHLRERLANVKAATDQAAARDRKIEAEIKRLEAERREDRLDAVRHDESPATGNFQHEIDALEAERREIAEGFEAAKTVGVEIEKELHYLLVQQFDAFADHAEALGAEAVKALEALRTAYDETESTWRASQSEWNVLVDAHNEGRGSGPGPTIRADGSVRTSEDAPPKLSKAPGCPLRPAAEVFGADPPRPPELEVDVEAD